MNYFNRKVCYSPGRGGERGADMSHDSVSKLLQDRQKKYKWYEAPD